MIHFPGGQRPIPIVPENLGTDLVRALSQANNTAQSSSAGAVDDTISVHSLHAAVDLGLMNHGNPNTAPAGAADYQLARSAALASEPVISMHHLGDAVQQSPAYASVALEDPAFSGMRDQVQDLASRMNPVGGADQTAGAATYQPPRGVLPTAVVTNDAPIVSQQPIVTSLPQTVDIGQDPAPNPTNALPQTAIPSPSPSAAQPDTTSRGSSVPTGHSPALPGQPASPMPIGEHAISAALDLELLHSFDSEPARATSANQYQLAQTAIQAGDRPAALQHLEQAILSHPAQAAAALADPAFDSIRGAVRDLVTRLLLTARVHAEASISEARSVLQSAGTSIAARSVMMARVYLQSAQASYQLGTYTGYAQAAFAAELAQRIAKEKTRSRRWGLAFAPLERMVKQSVIRLWRSLPVLAILLGWFVTGVVAAVASLPFDGGAAFRGWLLPVWSIGLVCVVLFGFVRSVRSATRRRS